MPCLLSQPLVFGIGAPPPVNGRQPTPVFGMSKLSPPPNGIFMMPIVKCAAGASVGIGNPGLQPTLLRGELAEVLTRVPAHRAAARRGGRYDHAQLSRRGPSVAAEVARALALDAFAVMVSKRVHGVDVPPGASAKRAPAHGRGQIAVVVTAGACSGRKAGGNARHYSTPNERGAPPRRG